MDDLEARFLAAIAADPSDDEARLVYADWLIERGDPRGEYLRVEIAVYNGPSRLKALAAQLDPAWLDQVTRRFRVMLVDPIANMIGAIKVVRELTGLGLKDAKDFVDNVRAYGPRMVIDELSHDEANDALCKFPPEIKVRIEHMLRGE
jgi:uncharacterized protein (TIGR02996 family)